MIAAEPRGANDAADVAECKARGELVRLASKPLTIADGLQGARIPVLVLHALLF